MDDLAARYQGRVQFLLVYSYEAHPEQWSRGGIDPIRPDIRAEARTLSERDRLARDFQDQYQIQRRLVVDDFDEKSAAWRLLGRTSYTHPLVVLDVKGRLALSVERGSVADLDAFLADLLAAGPEPNSSEGPGKPRAVN
jgi:hypothetical protein